MLKDLCQLLGSMIRPERLEGTECSSQRWHNFISVYSCSRIFYSYWNRYKVKFHVRCCFVWNQSISKLKYFNHEFQVNAIYQDPSLGANLQLVITHLFLYESKKESVFRLGHARRSLENANAWNRRLHLALAPGEPHHDVAIWLTRLDFGGPSGYAPVGGACDPTRSCTINRDEGLVSSFIIAHEIAHLLVSKSVVYFVDFYERWAAFYPTQCKMDFFKKLHHNVIGGGAVLGTFHLEFLLLVNLIKHTLLDEEIK